MSKEKQEEKELIGSSISFTLPTGLTVNVASNELDFESLGQAALNLKYLLENPEKQTKPINGMIG